MELLRLKRRLLLAEKGHKLLKDKQDELVRHFLERIRQARDLRAEVEQALTQFHHTLALAQASSLPGAVDVALSAPAARLQLTTRTTRILHLHIPEVTVEIEGSIHPYGFGGTPAALDLALAQEKDLFATMLRLAGLERAVTLLSDEIEKTRRRVNALEHILIPDLRTAIRTITMKLEELERSNFIRLMKVKELMEKRKQSEEPAA